MSRRVRARAVATALGIAVVIAAVAAPAGASTTEGIVVGVPDGDTIDVRSSATTTRYRLTGVQAMELGECHADAATDALRDLVDGRSVTLSAYDAGQSSRGRPLRHVDAGATDVGLELLERGLALAFPHPVNGQRDRAYALAQAGAEQRGRGIWDDDACGAGPSQGARLALHVTWDADGDDTANVAGETVEVRHLGGPAVDLGGWQLRDTALNRLDLPSRTLRSGEQLVVTVGDATPGADVAWGGDEPIFENAGDGAYLLDPDGDVRAHRTWPCVADCAPRLADVELTLHSDAQGDDAANPDGEWVNVRNLGTSTLDLTDLRLVSEPHVLALPTGTRVPAGGRLRVSIGSPTAPGADLGWDRDAGILDNTGDAVELRDEQGTVLARASSTCRRPCGAVPDVRIDRVVFDAPGDDTTNPNGERVVLRNAGTATVDLQDWAVASWPYVLDLHAPSPLRPGATLEVRIGAGTDTAGTRHWGRPSGILGNGGDQVRLLTPHRDVADCHDWGSSSGDCPPADRPSVERIGAQDGVAAGVAASRWAFDRADVAVLARVDVFPDALGGGALAIAARGPLLLTGSASLDGRVRDELARLGTRHVYVLGGEAALSRRVVDQLSSRGIGVTRLSGPDRFATAVAVADELERLDGRPDTYVLATSHAFPDALVASNLAVAHGAPVLLTHPDDLHSRTAARLASSSGADVLVVGGRAAVADAVAREADRRAGTVRRLSGADRYRTAIAVADERLRDGPRGRGWVVTTGERFADAVTAGPAAAARDAVLVLGHPDPSHPSAIALEVLAGALGEVPVTAASVTSALPTDTPARLLR